jgi:16S rRNA (cytosine967-C5)-methyltransferase
MEPETAPSLVSDLVLTIFARTRMEWARLADETSSVLRDARQSLAPSVRREIIGRLRELVGGLRRLDFAIGPALRRLGRARQDLARYLALEVLSGRTEVSQARRRLPALDWDRVLAVEELVSAIPSPLTRIGTRHSIPDWAAQSLIDAFGESGAEACAAALNTPPPRTLRTNLLKIERDELAKLLRREGFEAEPTRHALHGLQLSPFSEVLGSALYGQGLFEAQDEASQLAVDAVAPPPRGLVLDACAGAGGKALAIASLLGGSGQILAVDVAASKIRALRRRLRRSGAFQIRALVTAPDDWPAEVHEFAGRADRILVDAPCSGIGAWRRRPEMRWVLGRSEAQALAARQLELASRAARALKPGARLIYATCTFERRENEAIVEALLARDPGLEPVRISEILGRRRAGPIADPTGTYLALAPHRHGCDGFFAAVVRRRGEAPEPAGVPD